jgi:hypothetical protein
VGVVENSCLLQPATHDPYTEIPDEQTKRTKREKNTHSEISRLEKRRSFSYTITRIILFFDYAASLCTMKNKYLVISNLT